MGNNPSLYKGEPNRPVDTVSWNEAQEFLRKLSAREGGKPYRLPTEAEWEYACRAGSTGAYYFGDNVAMLGEYAWYTKTRFVGLAKALFAIKGPHPVGQLKPNAWGLYDMLGNVWEWVQDWYVADYYKQRPNPDCDPQGPEKGKSRVLRGGSWGNEVRGVRVSVRFLVEPGLRNDYLGFRCAQ
jgi:formylglycine-generating enzyme required for sulfatase activity